MRLAEPANSIGLSVVFVVSFLLGAATEFTTTSLENTSLDGARKDAAALVPERVLGNRSEFVVIELATASAFPSRVIGPRPSVASVLVQAVPALDVTGTRHEGFAAPTLAHTLNVSAHSISSYIVVSTDYDKGKSVSAGGEFVSSQMMMLPSGTRNFDKWLKCSTITPHKEPFQSLHQFRVHGLPKSCMQSLPDWG